MKADYPLLGVLARGPMSGYDLGKWLQADGLFLGRKSSMTPIYRALSDFSDRGWVEPELVERESAPAAKVYRLTASGQEALAEWARSDYEPTPRPMAPDFFVRLSFAGQLGPQIALRLVDTELEYRLAQRAEEAPPGLERPADPIPGIDPDWAARLQLIVKSRGWQSTSLYIGWLQTVKTQLEAQVAEQVVPDGGKKGAE